LNRAERRALAANVLLEDRSTDRLPPARSRSLRSIARACGYGSHAPVLDLERELIQAGQIHPRTNRPGTVTQGQSGPNANLVRARPGMPSAATTHGTNSETFLAPLRSRLTVELHDDFPWLDDRRLALLADLLARIELGSRWLDAKGTVVRNRSGDAYPIAMLVEKWSARADALLRELHAEKARRQAADADVELAAAMEEAVA
jgi:hypothetical protein